jgi:hypothetical protein
MMSVSEIAKFLQSGDFTMEKGNYVIAGNTYLIYFYDPHPQKDRYLVGNIESIHQLTTVHKNATTPLELFKHYRDRGYDYLTMSYTENNDCEYAVARKDTNTVEAFFDEKHVTLPFHETVILSNWAAPIIRKEDEAHPSESDYGGDITIRLDTFKVTVDHRVYYTESDTYSSEGKLDESGNYVFERREELPEGEDGEG